MGQQRKEKKEEKTLKSFEEFQQIYFPNSEKLITEQDPYDIGKELAQRTIQIIQKQREVHP